MNCAQCHNPVTPDAAFCGNCGQLLGQLPVQPTSTQPNNSRPFPVPTSLSQPSIDPRTNPQAIAAIVFGVLGCAGWLIPIIGVILGILAIIFGTIGLRSQKRKLAITGMVLAIPVIAFSLFVWIQAAKELMDEQANHAAPASTTADLQTVTTPCYSTRLPNILTISQSSNSCDFRATSATTGDLYQVKVLDIPDLNANNLATAAKADVDNVVSLITSASIDGEQDSMFVGSPAYTFTLKAADGSAGTITYIHHGSSSGNLVIVFHSQRNGTNFGLEAIENNWYWR